jgi:hypothetical protein
MQVAVEPSHRFVVWVKRVPQAQGRIEQTAEHHSRAILSLDRLLHQRSEVKNFAMFRVTHSVDSRLPIA